MTKWQRIRNVLFGVVTLLLAIILLSVGPLGTILALLVLGLSLVVYGLKYLIYYLQMARYMVGGKSMLYRGIIVLDMGAYALTMFGEAQILILMYLLFLHGLSGAIDILRGWEAKKMGSPLWKQNVVHGIVDLAIVLVGTIFLRQPNTVLYVYCFGLVYSGVARILSVFRRTAIVYIS